MIPTVVPSRASRLWRALASPGLLMIGVVVSCLTIANLLEHGRLQDLWTHTFRLRLGPITIRESVTTIVVEGLMTSFFLCVGLEIKREVKSGSLRSFRAASTPVLCAVGGMLMPALLFLLVNRSTATSAGWGTPTATDVALAVTVLITVAPHISPGARIFLLTLAVADDLGGIAIIWIWYSRGARVGLALIAIGALVATSAAMKRGLVRLPHGLMAMVPAWLLLRSAHIEPAIVGAMFGLLAPVTSTQRTPSATSDADRVLRAINPMVSWVVLPLFGAVSASISIDTSSVDARLVVGVAVALCVGKPLGIFGTAWLLRRTRIGEMPTGMTMSEMLGVAMLAGVGFTVALFIARASFPDESLRGSASVGVLVGSTSAVLLGGCYFAVHRIRSRSVLRAPTQA